MINQLLFFAATPQPGDFCPIPDSNIFIFPKWYHYLHAQYAVNSNGLLACNNQPSLGSLSDVWLIVAAIVEILLRLAAMFAVGYVIWGGIQYTLSEGDPEKTKRARHTIINALVGLAIAILSATVVNFIAGQITQ